MTMDLDLTLFFTEGVALQTWHQVGMLEREVAFYDELVRHGTQVRFITYGHGADLDLGRQLPGIEVQANRWRLPRAWYQRATQWSLPKAHHSIYKSNQIPGSLFAMRAAQAKGATFVARAGYWWADFAERRYGQDSPEARQARATEAQAFRGAAAAVVTTDWIRAGLIARYALDPNKVHVIPNYVQTDIFQPKETQKLERFQLVYVGRLAQEKNLSALLEAVSTLDLDLNIIGMGPEQNSLEALAKRSSATVRFLGSLPNRELPTRLNRAHAFVLPSLHEGQPKTLQEAMACGLPVVGCDVVGVRTLIQHRRTGLLTGTSSIEIRKSIEELMSDAALRRRLGANARQYVLEHFSLSRIVDQELALYREVLA